MFHPMRSRAARRFGGVAVMLALCTLSGCGDNGRLPTRPVTGMVKLDDKPLANAEIWLVPTTEEVKNAKLTIRPYARSRPDGTFTVSSYLVDDGAPLGEYAVMVVASGGTADSEEDRQTDTPSDRKPEKGRSKRPPLPVKYKTPSTSGLSFTVQDGPNELTLDLKSK
jgi:hypothetical protein